MIRTLGLPWLLAVGLGLLALSAAGVTIATADAVEWPMLMGLAAIGLALLAFACALLAAPLALAPAEALSASLSSGGAPWGAERDDIWGGLARAVADRLAPASAAPDPGIEMRRLAANLELTLRETGAELAAVRATIGAAATTLAEAAASSDQLVTVAGEATQQLAEAVRRADDATGALAALPALASEQAGTLAAAAARTHAAAEAIEDAVQALQTPPMPVPVEPSPAEQALHETVARGAEQARRLEQAMPLLLEAIARLPAAATSQARLDAVATALEGTLAPLRATSERIGAQAAALEIPDYGAALAPSLARIDDAAEVLRVTAIGAAEAAVTRVCDIAEVVTHDAAWRAGEAAARAVRAVEAASLAAAAEAEASGVALAARLADVVGTLEVARAETERRTDEALARIEAPIAAREAALAALAVRLDAAAAELEAAVADDTARQHGEALAGEARALLERLEAVAGTLDAAARALTAPPAIAVGGEEPLDSVAERLLAELAAEGQGADPASPALLGSLDETIRRLQSVAGAIAARGG